MFIIEEKRCECILFSHFSKSEHHISMTKAIKVRTFCHFLKKNRNPG